MTINPKDIQSAGKKVAGTALVLAGVGTFIWVSMVLVDILSFYFAYWASHNILENYGVDEYTAKMISAVFALIIALLAHGLLWSIIKRNHKRWIPAVTATMLLWFGIMYAVSSPYTGSPFNPFNGQTQKYYRDQYKKLHVIGRGATVGPYGEPVLLFDKNSAQEYERQQNPTENDLPKPESTTTHTPDFISSLFSGFTKKPEALSASGVVEAKIEREHLLMWVEKIEIAPELTVLHIAVESTPREAVGKLRANKKPSEYYLVDGGGRVSEFVGEQHNTPGRDFSHSVTYGDGEGNVPIMHIRPQEIYRYTATFKPIASNVKHLSYYSKQFPVLSLDKLLISAERRSISSVTIKENQLQAEQAKLEAEIIAKTQAEAREKQAVKTETAAIPHTTTQQPGYSLYSQRGPTPEQFSRDQYECQAWAKQQTRSSFYGSPYDACMTGRGYVAR